MNTATVTQIKSVANSLEALTQFGIEINLVTILHQEFEQGLSSDISNGF